MATPVIYFICAGTSSNDLGKTGKNNLSYLGYKQLCNLRENNYFKNNILNADCEILTSANRNCVESSLILFSDVSKKTVNVVPYLSDKREKPSNYEQFFHRNLVNSYDKHYLQSLNYGENHYLQNLIKELPNVIADLNTNIKNYYFNSSKFMDLLEQKIKINNPLGKNIVVICNPIIIRNILSKLSSSKYRDIKHESFEKSSIWEIKYNYSVVSNKITYNLFSKKYPIPTNHKPLKYENGKYLCEFKGRYIPLFEKPSQNLLNSLSISKNNKEEKLVLESTQKNNSKSLLNIITSH
jgi:hypothetical protein